MHSAVIIEVRGCLLIDFGKDFNLLMEIPLLLWYYGDPQVFTGKLSSKRMDGKVDGGHEILGLTTGV